MVIFSLRVVWARAVCASAAWTRPLEADLSGHRGHHRGVAVGADAHRHLVGEVDAVDEFEEAVDEMAARLFAVGDDVDAGVFLQLHDEDGGVALGAGELVVGQAPWRP